MRHAFALACAVSLAIPSLLQAANPNAAGGGSTTYALTAGNTRVQVSSTYAFSVYDATTGAVLLTQNGTSFMIGGKAYTDSTLRNVTVTGTTLSGVVDIVNGKTKGTVNVSLTLSGNVLHVDYTGATVNSAAPTAVTESFADGGEHLYGLWEHAYGASIDNRGVSKPYVGTETFDGGSSSPVSQVGGVFAASARAPFFMTSKNIGVYTPTESAGSYALAVNSATSETFNVPELHYEVFHGASPKEVMGMYNTAAGAPSRLPPLWAFDSIWWRDDAHALPAGIANAQALLVDDGDKLQQYQIPAGAIWIDRPYGSDTANRDSNVGGWGNMDFDPAAFPNPDQMVSDLRARGLRTMLWVANKANNSLYTQAYANGYLFNGYSSSPALDLRNPDAALFMQGQLSVLLNAAQLYPAPGISGFKIDRGGEGEMPSAQINQLTTLMQKTAAAALQSQVGGDYFTFARNINDTGRQYAAVWSGDPVPTFQGLQTSVINGIRSGLMNFPMWGSDIGGYSSGTPTKELYARWFGFGTYSPMMEVMQMPGRTVWLNYDAALISIASAAARAHHDLMPYMYSLAAENRTTGVPILRAMVLEFPADTAAQTLNTQYMFGPSLLVAPVVTSGVTTRSVYLPAGRWLDYNARTAKYAGAATVTAAAPLGTVPVFVREGAIIPRGDILQSNNNWTAGWAPALRIECFPGVAGGSAASTSFSYFDGTASSTITSTTNATGVHLAANLPYGGTFDVYCNAPSAVMVNGLAVTNHTYDAATKRLRVPYAAGPVTVDLQGSQSIWP